MWQLFYQFTLGIIQPLFESIYYDLIDSLNLSIPLRISQGGILIRNSQVTIVPPEGLTIKLKVIIRNEGIRDPKLSDNILPNKSLGIQVPDIDQWFNFNPLGEVICVDRQIPLIPNCPKERTHNVQALLSEWLRAGQRIKDSSRLMNVGCKSLALITLLHILLCFLLHVWPLVALSDGFVRQRSASYIASTNPFM